jgi:hypothetical protein
MANPQPTDAHLRIAYSIQEQIMMSMFPERPLRAMLFILRLSWGCGKHSAYIPRQRDFALCGVGESHIKQVLIWLINANVIIRDGDYYQFNKDFDRWHVTRVIDYSPEKLTELVSLNLNKSDKKLTELVSNEDQELTKKGSYNLPKREVLETTPIILKQDIKTNNNTCIVVFDFWNKQKITVHRKILPDIQTAINSTLKSYTSEEIQTAITNYADIVSHPNEYWFNYRWTLKDFLKRGLEKFLDGEIAKQNYLKQNNGGQNGITQKNNNGHSRSAGQGDSIEELEKFAQG